MIDDDGCFKIVDRKKEMIIVSGFNVYPTDIEQALYHNPKIEKVASSASRMRRRARP